MIKETDIVNKNNFKLPKSEIVVHNLISENKDIRLNKIVRHESKFLLFDLLISIIVVIACIIFIDYINIDIVLIITIFNGISYIILINLIENNIKQDYQLRDDLLYINSILNDKEQIYTVEANSRGRLIIYKYSEWSKNELISLKFTLMKGKRSAVKVYGPIDGDIINIKMNTNNIEIIKSKKVESHE